jgi:hypothetical protein
LGDSVPMSGWVLFSLVFVVVRVVSTWVLSPVIFGLKNACSGCD